MNLPKLHSKQVLAGLGAGLILGGAGLAVAVTGDTPPVADSAPSSQAITAPAQPPTTATDSTAPEAAPAPSATSSNAASSSTPSVLTSPASSSAGAATQTPAPATITDINQRTQPGNAPDSTDFYCDYDYSDGTTTENFVGGASNADIATHHLTFSCPPPR